MRLMYHVTEKASLESILREGIQPRIGPRSVMLGEVQPAVYLFPCWVACTDGLTNWLGDELSDDIELVILELDVSGLALTHAAGFEVIAVTTLDPSCITRVLDEAGHTLQPEGSGPAWGRSHNQRRS